jgi:hypothetical protein
LNAGGNAGLLKSASDHQLSWYCRKTETGAPKIRSLLGCYSAPTPSVKPGTAVVCDESVANLTLSSVFNQDAPGEAIKEHARGGGATGFPADRRDPI